MSKNHRRAFQALIAESEVTQREAAEILTKLSGDFVHERKVRKWLAVPPAEHSRCPGWAVYILKDGLEKRK